MKYGEKIRYVRVKVRGMTLKELATKADVSVSYLSDAELGRVSMSIKALEKVAVALNVTASYLLDSRNMTLQQLADLNQVELPQNIIEYVTKQKSLPYISLIKEIDEGGTFSLEFLKNLIKIHEIEANKTC